MQRSQTTEIQPPEVREVENPRPGQLTGNDHPDQHAHRRPEYGGDNPGANDTVLISALIILELPIGYADGQNPAGDYECAQENPTLKAE